MPNQEQTNKEITYTIKEMLSHRFDEITDHLTEIKQDVKDTKAQATRTNGRVTSLEQWSEEAQKKINNTSKQAETIAIDYGKDQTRIWTTFKIGGALISTILVLGGIVAYYKVRDIAKEVSEQYLFNKNDIEYIKEIK